MQRVLASVAATLFLVTVGFFVWRAQARGGVAVVPAPATAMSAGPMGLADLAGPPAASERTREEKRFARYDRDRNGAVGREEYLLSRRKAFAKLDLNHDGKLSFDEYAVKTEAKFAAADGDKNNTLTATEFAATRVVRKDAPRSAPCRPTPRLPEADPPEEG